MIAHKITQARLEKREIIHHIEVKKLSEIALKKVSDNFMLYPSLNNLDEKYKIKVYDQIKLDYPIEVTFPLINYENFWKRACKDHFKTEDCSLHGNSWKQCYAENYIKKLVTNFNNSTQDLSNITKVFEIMKYHTFNLEIPTFSSDFNISKIPEYFINITRLELKYSPILKDKTPKDLLKTKLTPIADEYNKFGMRMADLKQFSVAIGELNYLLSLTLQGNFIDDEMTTWLVPGLISNHTLRALDISNNKITDQGIINLSSYLMRTRTLMSLDLTNNYIGSDGGFAMSLVIKEDTRLKYIKLGMNRIDDNGGYKILRSLSQNEFIEELDLSSNDLGHHTSESLIIALRLNKTIKYIDLSYTNIHVNSDTKIIIEKHPVLIKLDLRSTKCSSSDIRIIDTVLIKKSVKHNLKDRIRSNSNLFV